MKTHNGPVANLPISSRLNLTLRQCTFPILARRNQAGSWTCRLSTIRNQFVSACLECSKDCLQLFVEKRRGSDGALGIK